jgi:MFS family permease
MIMTASFVVVPALLSERLGLSLQSHSLLYLAVLVVGFIAMVPLVIRAERRGAIPVKRLAIVLLAVSQVLLALADAALWHYVVALLVFFAAFNLLEALLPSLVGRAAPAGTRGTAMGVYSSSQFMGVFVGGQLGGALYQWLGPEAVFYGCMVLAVVWLLVLTGMQELPRLENRVLHLQPGQDWLALSQRLHQVPGVEEVVVVETQAMVLLKIDTGSFDEGRLQGLAAVAQS